jgi:hypothetical protein
VKWLNHFIGFVKPTPDKKVLLVMDGHGSHKSLEAIEVARSHGVVMICLPPHTTHRMQPLDRTFYGPLKQNYNAECDKWMVHNAGCRISQYDQASLFGSAYIRTATMEKAVSGFRCSGLWPFNPDIFSEEDFLPSVVTDEPQPGEVHETAPADQVLQSPSLAAVPSGFTVLPEPADHAHLDTSNATPLRSVVPAKQADRQPDSSNTVASDSRTSFVASTPESEALAAVRVLSPLPTSKAVRKRKRKIEGAQVVTSTPTKMRLIEMSTKKKPKVQTSARKEKARKKLTCRMDKPRGRKAACKKTQSAIGLAPVLLPRFSWTLVGKRVRRLREREVGVRR